MDITKEIEFLESIDCEVNENEQFIYTSTNGASSINLHYILKEYLQYVRTNTPTK